MSHKVASVTAINVVSVWNNLGIFFYLFVIRHYNYYEFTIHHFFCRFRWNLSTNCRNNIRRQKTHTQNTKHMCILIHARQNKNILVAIQSNPNNKHTTHPKFFFYFFTINGIYVQFLFRFTNFTLTMILYRRKDIKYYYDDFWFDI